MDQVLVAPSLLSADFLHLADDLAAVASADIIHYDVMDGHFVPNLSFGLDILRQVKAASSLPLDVHLMIANPDEMLDAYLDVGADIVSIHPETTHHVHRLVSRIHEAGARASVALNPATPVSVLEDIIDQLDMVLIMSVNPGFGGQSFIEQTYMKLERLHRLCREAGVSPLIEVDGGVSQANAAQLKAAGVHVFVAGSAIFKSKDPASAIASIRACAQADLEA